VATCTTNQKWDSGLTAKFFIILPLHVQCSNWNLYVYCKMYVTVS
jgi:hypothetical protein